MAKLSTNSAMIFIIIKMTIWKKKQADMTSNLIKKRRKRTSQNKNLKRKLNKNLKKRKSLFEKMIQQLQLQSCKKKYGKQINIQIWIHTIYNLQTSFLLAM